MKSFYMKRMHFFSCLFAMFITWSLSAQQTGQDSTGLPGDNFSLQGALDQFKLAASPEEFEKQSIQKTITSTTWIWMVDGKTDYVRVVDQSEGESHALYCRCRSQKKKARILLSSNWKKMEKESAIVQIVGDSDIYGEEVIVEPSPEAEKETPTKGKGPNSHYAMDEPIVVVNVWGWPSVRYVYAPAYHPWASPYYWHYYPSYWHPWRPVAWHVWHPYHYNYHRCVRCYPNSSRGTCTWSVRSSSYYICDCHQTIFNTSQSLSCQHEEDHGPGSAWTSNYSEAYNSERAAWTYERVKDNG
jgi:hypothetical protein